MGATLWVLGDARIEDEDTRDHSAMYAIAEQLDLLCDGLAVPKLSSFFDWTDYYANMQINGLHVPKLSSSFDWTDFDAKVSDDDCAGDQTKTERPMWFEANLALPTLQALRSEMGARPISIAHGQPLCDANVAQRLIEELDHCIARIQELAARGKPFRLCVVM